MLSVQCHSNYKINIFLVACPALFLLKTFWQTNAMWKLSSLANNGLEYLTLSNWAEEL